MEVLKTENRAILHADAYYFHLWSTLLRNQIPARHAAVIVIAIGAGDRVPVVESLHSSLMPSLRRNRARLEFRLRMSSTPVDW